MNIGASLREKQHISNIELNDFYEYYKQGINGLESGEFNVELMAEIENFVNHKHFFDNLEFEIINDILNKVITIKNWTNQCIRKLKNRKAPGIDGISSEFLKYGGESLKKPILALFNYVLKSGDYPSQCPGGGYLEPLAQDG